MENRLLVRRASRDQWIILTVAVVGLVASFVLQVKPYENDAVYIRFVDQKLPGTCFSRTVFGGDCPGCGLTRSIVCLSQGELTRSLQFNIAGIFLYVCAIGYTGFMLTRTRIPVHSFYHTHDAWTSFVWTSTCLLICQWGFKIVT